MRLGLPIILLSCAVAAPGASAYAKAKDKKHAEQKSGDRRDDRDGDREGDRDHGEGDGGKITICHVPPGNRSARHTITVGESAWRAHRAHGDHRGACGAGGGGGTPHDPRFDNLDRNHNGVLSPDEWAGDAGTFGRLDRNHDGVLSREEYSHY